MITEDNWLGFIGSFFNVDIEWISHVTKNWNHLKNESGCGCHYESEEYKSEYEEMTYIKDSEYCADWLRIKAAHEENLKKLTKQAIDSINVPFYPKDGDEFIEATFIQ